MTRQLVTIRTVKELLPIEGADKIELSKVDGWQCVVKKGDFKVGDQGLFFEIDSVLPGDDERFAFLEQRKFRIKSMKLRGVLSQGLLMPMSILTDEELTEINFKPLDEVLRVQKYEPPMPIGGQQKGTFPTHLVPKTDQERIQNIPEILENGFFTERSWEVTEKLDGTSCTFFWHPYKGEIDSKKVMMVKRGACSRNWEMELDDSNVYAKLWHELELQDKLLGYDNGLAIQGEIIGPGIQGNKYKRAKQEFYVFDIYDIDAKKYLGALKRWELCEKLDLQHVPLIDAECNMDVTLDDLLEMADGTSRLYDTKREGLVFKAHDGLSSFKVISNKFLLKNE